MATRARQVWKPDPKGYYTRQLGWKQSKTGKLVQHKFILGTDLREAQRREAKLRELWETYEASQDEATPLWPEPLLKIARSVAKGVATVSVPRKPGEMQWTYADRIRRMQLQYPVVCFAADDEPAHEVGQYALRALEAVPKAPVDAVPLPSAVNVEMLNAIREAEAILEKVGLKTTLDPRQLAQAPAPANSAFVDTSLSEAIQPARTPNPAAAGAAPEPVRSRTPYATLHDAMKAYQRYLEKEYHRPELEQMSAWGQTQYRQVDTLKRHHSDMLLSRLDGSTVEELFAYWRRRPCKKGKTVPMTAQSSSNYIAILQRFLRWLHKSPAYDWRKPEDFDEIQTRVRVLPNDHDRKKLDQVATFTLAELQLLMRYAQPFERSLILLALNCGFGRAEVASLLIREVHLHCAHDPHHQELLCYKTTDSDSFVKRIRRKSGVYGEHILFPLTVQGIEWALERRQRFPGFSADARLLVNAKGTPLDTPTKEGNATQLIPNHFARLIKRIQDDNNQIRPLSFNKLRKTASQLIRNFSNGEIMGVFDCHGRPVKSDSLSDLYSNRPFGKVFEAIRKVEAYLAPVFEEAGPTPFVQQARVHTKHSTIDRTD